MLVVRTEHLKTVEEFDHILEHGLPPAPYGVYGSVPIVKGHSVYNRGFIDAICVDGRVLKGASGNIAKADKAWVENHHVVTPERYEELVMHQFLVYCEKWGDPTGIFGAMKIPWEWRAQDSEVQREARRKWEELADKNPPTGPVIPHNRLKKRRKREVRMAKPLFNVTKRIRKLQSRRMKSNCETECKALSERINELIEREARQWMR